MRGGEEKEKGKGEGGNEPSEAPAESSLAQERFFSRARMLPTPWEKRSEQQNEEEREGSGEG